MRPNYNLDAHLPNFLQDEIERTFFREFLTLTNVPNKSEVSSINEDKVKWFCEYLKTADLYEAYWRTGHPDLESREKVPKKVGVRLREASTWLTWKYLLWRTMKRIRAGLYVKILDDIFLPDDIHPQFLNWMKRDNLFGDQGMCKRLQVFEVGVNKITNPLSTPQRTAVKKSSNKADKSSKITVESVPISEAIPANLKKMPIIGGLDKDVSELDIETYRRHLTNIHVGNLHLIALSDEERSADRIKASEIILKHVGAFELDNKQKTKVEIPEETVKLLEYLQEKQQRLHQYVKQLNPFDKEYVTVDVEKEEIVSRQTVLKKGGRIAGKPSYEAEVLATKIIEENRLNKNLEKAAAEDKIYDKLVYDTHKHTVKASPTLHIIDKDADILLPVKTNLEVIERRKERSKNYKDKKNNDTTTPTN